MAQRVRFGVLGAARITPKALVEPARALAGEVEVYAIAARDRGRAERQAAKLGIPKVHDSYEALLADPDVEAVYNPLPNALHAEWSIRAMEAGKHVLCEKPIANNAREAEQMAEAARRTGRILCEAMHMRYHPVHERIPRILESGELGAIRHAEAHACFLIANARDIRWQYSLGGGALMDLGVYPIMNIRNMLREEPEVVSARARVASPNVDRWIEAHLRFPSGATGRVLTSMWGWPLVEGEHFIEGAEAKLQVNDRIGLFQKLDLYKNGKRVWREKLPTTPSTYQRQLAAFVRAVRTGAPTLTGPEHFIPNMRVVDAIYRAAGLPVRGAAA